MSETAPKNDEAARRKMAEQEAYRKTCDKYVAKGLARNTTIQFLLTKLKDMGCQPPKGFIKCMDCGDRQAGAGFGVIEETVLNDTCIGEQQNEDAQRRMSLPQCQLSLKDVQDQLAAQSDGKTTTSLKLKPEIFLCQQHLRNETHAHESMVHELIHAIDMCRTKMDPIHNCIHLACTEIRAENLSGECSWTKEIARMKAFPKHGQECVKRRAKLSMLANPNCAERADEYIDACFDRCYRDTFPFDRHPNLR